MLENNKTYPTNKQEHTFYLRQNVFWETIQKICTVICLLPDTVLYTRKGIQMFLLPQIKTVQFVLCYVY